MKGFDKLAALLDRPLPRDPRPNLYDALAESEHDLSTPHDYSGIELPPGAAIAAFVASWLAEHWPALAIGGAAGLLAIVIPAMILAPALASGAGH